MFTPLNCPVWSATQQHGSSPVRKHNSCPSYLPPKMIRSDSLKTKHNKLRGIEISRNLPNTGRFIFQILQFTIRFGLPALYCLSQRLAVVPDGFEVFFIPIDPFIGIVRQGLDDWSGLNFMDSHSFLLCCPYVCVPAFRHLELRISQLPVALSCPTKIDDGSGKPFVSFIDTGIQVSCITICDLACLGGFQQGGGHLSAEQHSPSRCLLKSSAISSNASSSVNMLRNLRKKNISSILSLKCFGPSYERKLWPYRFPRCHPFLIPPCTHSCDVFVSHVSCFQAWPERSRSRIAGSPVHCGRGVLP